MSIEAVKKDTSDLQDLLRWFAVRGCKAIKKKDIGTWRPDLRPAFDSMLKMRAIEDAGESYKLTSLGFQMLNEAKAGKL